MEVEVEVVQVLLVQTVKILVVAMAERVLPHL
jgi:hypothetical protein